jgi:transmembrane sensor
MKNESTYPVDLINSYFAGEANSDDLVFLSEWLKADPEHEAFFRSYRETWLKLEEERIHSQVDLDQEWSLLQKKMEPVAVPFYAGKYFRLAAILILLLIPAVFIYYYFAHPATNTITASGGWVEGKLPDGSLVTLNSSSSVQFPVRFSGNKRGIKLKGEAYFEVTHDKTKPFIIASQNVRIRVLGTSFYVNTNAMNGGMEVILSSGKVEIFYENDESGKVVLHPGERADISLSRNDITKTVNDDPNYLAWKTHKLIFTGESVDEIVATLNRIYHAKIRIADPALSHCLLTATFDNQSLGSVLKVLCATLNVRVAQNGAWTEISGKGCN